MIVRDPHEEAVLLTYIALDVLDDPNDGLVVEFAKKAKLRGPAHAYMRQAAAEMERLWPNPKAGQFGNVSPYLVGIEQKRGQPLWCRRGALKVPDGMVKSINRFGGVYQPIHLRMVGGDLMVVAGRKRVNGTIEVNRQRFLEWHDERIANEGVGLPHEGRCRLIATIPAMHLTLDLDACEDIATSENIERYNATKIDAVFAALRLKEAGVSDQEVAERLQCTDRTIRNYASLAALTDLGLTELQYERLALDMAFELAKRPAAEQDRLLNATRKDEQGQEMPARRRRAALMKLMGLAPPAGAVRTTATIAAVRPAWMDSLATRQDHDSVVAHAVLRFVQGDKEALRDHPDLQQVFQGSEA